ncbi:hypothetical protein ZOSMA_31G00500 [Zostera marina]|uniref:Uncharacterized protein n=1 Tax=Zostera marina TaxID=29655 RepID=A0A0K9PB95_ZOSMR|nr:hypothetical protein ZOSMA_31G00500 [Zostera marina]
MQLAFTKEMPTHGSTQIKLDLSLLLGPVFYKWVIELIFPVRMINLHLNEKLLEKEQLNSQ